MATVYDSAFFSLLADDSLKNARLIVPLVMEMLRPESVVDFGCGPGAWLRVFVENGVNVIRGIDGDYIDPSTLLIDQAHFSPADLTKPIILDRKYDLALCIEVAEHLPSEYANALIELLTSSAPAVLFSAAIPGQGGTNHLNEQWLGYWRDLFAKQGFSMIDTLRPRIRDDSRVAFYIRQNLVLFLDNIMLASRPTLDGRADDAYASNDEWVHADLYRTWLSRATTKNFGVKEIVSRLPAAILRSIARRLKRDRALQEIVCQTKQID